LQWWLPGIGAADSLGTADFVWELTMVMRTGVLGRVALLAAALQGGAALAQAPDPGAQPATKNSGLSTGPIASAAPAEHTSPPLVAAAAPVLLPTTGPAAPLEAPRPAAPVGRRRHIIGLELDAGVPDGASATLLYRPWSYVRFGGGLLYDYVGYGVRGGVSVLPYFPIAPSLTLEVGHYFEADASEKVARFVDVDDDLKPMLKRVGYTFANAQLGLEIGHPDWFVFFVRAGISRVWLSVHDVQQGLSSSSNLRTLDDPSIRLGIPNAKVGFMIFFY
jgi:hypothetical protein